MTFNLHLGEPTCDEEKSLVLNFSIDSVYTKNQTE